MSLSFGNMTLDLNVFNITKHPWENEEPFDVDHISSAVDSCSEEMMYEYPTIPPSDLMLNSELNEGSEVENESDEEELEQGVHFAENWTPPFEKLSPDPQCLSSPREQIPTLELKLLPANLKYVFLGDAKTCPVIISSTLKEEEEVKLVKVLTKHKNAMGWKIADLKGISPLVCTHSIYLEEGLKPRDKCKGD